MKAHFLQDVRRVPVRVKPEALGRVTHLRRRTGRVFREVTATGEGWRV